MLKNPEIRTENHIFVINKYRMRNNQNSRCNIHTNFLYFAAIEIVSMAVNDDIAFEIQNNGIHLDMKKLIELGS